MKTRSRKTSPNTSNNRRKPLSDQTNNVTVSNNMKRKSNTKVTTTTSNTRQTRKNSLDASRRISNRLKGESPKKNVTKTTLREGKKSTKVKSLQNENKNKVKPEVKAKLIKEKITLKNVKTGQNPAENTKNKRLRSISKIGLNDKNKSLNNDDLNKTKPKTDSSSIKEDVGTRNTRAKSVDLNKTKLDTSIKAKSVEKIIKNRSLRSNSINVTNDNNKSEISEEKTEEISPQKNITNMTTDETNLELNVLKNPKNKRLLGSFKFTSPENNSDPYEFKIDSKEEQKRKPKKRRPKKHDGTLDTSDDEDKSFEPISKNTRKKQQQIHVTPVERKLRNRHIKVVRKTPQSIKKVPEKVTEKRVVKVPEKRVEKVPEIIPQPIPQTPEIIPQTYPKTPEILPQTYPKTPDKNMSVVDEINEIANTFLEDEEEDESISTPSRIDIMSNLIVRKSHQPSTQVFNSTMIHETLENVEPRSPWRVEISAIARKPLNISVKNKTPSHVPEFVIPSEKKQTTLLGFVNRQPKTDIPITLFDNKSPRKPFGDLSNSMSPIRQISPQKSDDSLFGFTVLSDSENKENTPVKRKSKTSPKLKKPSPKVPKVLIENTKKNEINIQENEVDKNIDISIDDIPLFEDLNDVSRNEKRYSRQYTRPHIKRKRNVSFKVDSDGEDSDSDTEIHVKKKQKDVLSKEEAEEAERLASHYNSYFEEIENYPLCIE